MDAVDQFPIPAYREYCFIMSFLAFYLDFVRQSCLSIKKEKSDEKNDLVTAVCYPAMFLFAQEGDLPPRDQGSGKHIMIGIAMVFFYFILWRPEQKRRKLMEQQRVP